MCFYEILYIKTTVKMKQLDFMSNIKDKNQKY